MTGTNRATTFPVHAMSDQITRNDLRADMANRMLVHTLVLHVERRGARQRAMDAARRPRAGLRLGETGRFYATAVLVALVEVI